MEEHLFRLIGSYGLWQKCILAILFYGNIVGMWQNYVMTFLAPNVPFRCVYPNDSISLDEDQWPGQCTVRPPNSTEELPCTQWEYDTSNYSDTFVNKFDLVCDREWLISFAKSVYMIGFMVSVFIFGQVSDRIGRYPTMLLCYTINCVSLILVLFSNSITVFLIFRFLQAVGRTGCTTMGYVLLLEVVGPRDRTFVGLLVQLGWSSSFFTLAFVGYFFRHWFWLQVAVAVPMFLLAFAFFYLPESPRWLLMQGKTEKLEKLVRTAARWNGKEVNEEVLKQLIKVKPKEEQTATILDLFRFPRMRHRTFNMMYLWLVNAFLYYAVSFNTNDFFGDPYLNFTLLGVLEFPSYAILYISMLRYGRRIVMVTFMLLTGATFVALICVPTDLPWLTTVFSQFGKFCMAASFSLLYLYTNEMFPTVVRSAALGSCSTTARIGSIVAPFSRELGKASHPTVPNVLYCVLAVTSGLFALWLPETKGRKLPDTLEEGENFEMKKL